MTEKRFLMSDDKYLGKQQLKNKFKIKQLLFDKKTSSLKEDISKRDSITKRAFAKQ